MNKYKSILKYFLVFSVFISLQTVLVPLISVGSFSPDFLLIFVVYLGVMRGHIWGSTAGFITGLLFDLISGYLLGSSAFSKTLSGFVAGYFYNEIKSVQIIKSVSFVLIVFLCSLINFSAFAVFTGFDSVSSLPVLLFDQALPPAVYTSLITLIYIFIVPKSSGDYIK